MSTKILKSLLAGYAIVTLAGLLLGGNLSNISIAAILLAPLFFLWPAILIVAVIAFLVLTAIEERKTN